ncbi:MAG TPA: O-antigen ligase family protein [Myxococcota bacterium]|nr:O-antigen ligase family protein [Myxococcota bacterium]
MSRELEQSTSAPFKLVVAATIAICVCLMAVADGNAAVALAPVFAGALAVALWRLPVRVIAHAMLFLALLLDNPTERPGRNLYKSPLYLPGTFLYEPLSKAAHLPGVKFTGLQLLVLLLFAIIGLRVLFGDTTDGKNRVPAASPLVRGCLVSIGTLLALWIYGLARGGKMNYSLLQMQTMLFMPIMTLFFAYAFKSRRDVRILLTTYLSVAVLRALLCIFYWLTVVRHLGDQGGGQEGDGSYVTTHSDSILASVAMVICVVTIYQRPRLRSFLLAAAVVPVVGLGIVANNRRIAFVAIALGCFFSYVAAPGPFRRRVHQTVLASLPVLLIYTAAGWNARGGWAKPVQSLKSVIQQKDASSATRDIENYNLLQTLKQNPLNGSGFGHMYLELVQAFDISGIFEAYRYVPHNSILWFWSVGGVLGFTAFWMFLSIGVFLAARLIRFAENNPQRILGMAAMSAVCAYGAQCYGDMGLMSWMGSLIVASSIGATASLAAKVGAWQGKERSLVTDTSEIDLKLLPTAREARHGGVS